MSEVQGLNNLAKDIVSVLWNPILTRYETAVWHVERGRFWSTLELFKENVISRALWAPLILLYISRLCSNHAYIQLSEYVQLIHAIVCASFIRHTTVIGSTLTGITRMAIANVDCEEALREFDTATGQSEAFTFGTDWGNLTCGIVPSMFQ